MKTFGLLVLMFLGLTQSMTATGPSKKADTTYCLQVEGKVRNADEGGENCKVELLMGEKVIDSLMLSSRGKFRFDLMPNQHYSIRISKPGFETKTVCVHTWLKEITEELFKFYFETTMLVPRPNTPAVSAPIAKIYFDEKKGCFYYSRMNNFASQKQTCEHI